MEFDDNEPLLKVSSMKNLFQWIYFQLPCILTFGYCTKNRMYRFSMAGPRTGIGHLKSLIGSQYSACLFQEVTFLKPFVQADVCQSPSAVLISNFPLGSSGSFPAVYISLCTKPEDEDVIWANSMKFMWIGLMPRRIVVWWSGSNKNIAKKYLQPGIIRLIFQHLDRY